MPKTFFGLSKHLADSNPVRCERLGLYVPDWLPEYLDTVKPDDFLTLIDNVRKLYTFHRVPPTVSKALGLLLVTVCNSVDLYVILDLLNTKNFRSEFRAHQREQLEQWLDSELLQKANPRCFRQSIVNMLTLKHNVDAYDWSLPALQK